MKQMTRFYERWLNSTSEDETEVPESEILVLHAPYGWVTMEEHCRLVEAERKNG